VTVHVPRRPYVEALPGIPTIRVFEALACGTPLICAPWRDSEGLFPEGAYLRTTGPEDMGRSLRAVLHDQDLGRELASTGLATIRNRHSCSHRVDELLSIFATIREPSGRDQRRCA
jgi:spore maturation protein CgeB